MNLFENEISLWLNIVVDIWERQKLIFLNHQKHL